MVTRGLTGPTAPKVVTVVGVHGTEAFDGIEFVIMVWRPFVPLPLPMAMAKKRSQSSKVSQTYNEWFVIKQD